jgi:hypothetical protein
MAVGWVIVFIAVAGLVGGLLNALFAAEGFIFSRVGTLPDGRKIWRPGFLGNVFVGMVTALVLTALYSPLGSISLGSAPATYDLTLAKLAGAFLSGLGGARLLTQEVGRHYDQVSQEQAKAVLSSLTKRPDDGENVGPKRK